MKTILRIVIILLIAGIVSGGIYALAQNTSLLSSGETERGQPPAKTSEDGQVAQTMERPERPDGGDEHGASLSRGLIGVGGTLGKLTGITILILLVQKAFSLINKRKRHLVTS